MYSTPEVSGDLLFIGSCAGLFYALDKNTGEVVWSYDITQDGDQNSFHGGMLITGDLVIIGTDTSIGHVYAFEKVTGRVRWKHLVAGTGAPTDILGDSSRVYTVADDDEALCLDLESGRLVWSFSDDADEEWPLLLTQSATLVAGRFIFGGQSGKVWALDAEVGDVLWTTVIGAPVSTSVISHSEDVFFGSANGTLNRLSHATGDILGQHVMEWNPTGRPTITGSGLYVFLNPDVGPGPGRGEQLVAVDLSLQKELWNHTPDFVWSATKSRIWKHTLVTGAETGELIAYDLDSGDGEWSAQLTGAIRSIGSFGNILYVGTLEGLVYAVDPVGKGNDQ